MLGHYKFIFKFNSQATKVRRPEIFREQVKAKLLTVKFYRVTLFRVGFFIRSLPNRS